MGTLSSKPSDTAMTGGVAWDHCGRDHNALHPHTPEYPRPLGFALGDLGFAKFFENKLESRVIHSACTKSAHCHRAQIRTAAREHAGTSARSALLGKDLDGSERVEELESLYFDTPGGKLREKGVSLRMPDLPARIQQGVSVRRLTAR